MADSNASIIQQTVKGIIAFISRTILLDLLTVGTSIVIISILSSSEVGIYTVVIAIQRVISFFTDFGFGAALVQKKENLTREDIQTSFTLQVTITSTVFLLVFIFRSFLISLLQLSGDGYNLLLSLVFTIFLSSFKVIPSILLERKIHFHILVIPQLVESIAFNVLLLMLVLNHRGISSYTWAFAISSVLSIPFYYIVSPWEIGVGINKKSLTHLKFGLQFQAKNVLATIKDDLLIALLPRFLSFSQIGFIGVGQSLASYPYRYIVDSITRVTFSTYSRFQNDMKLMRSAIEKSLFFVSLFMFPALTGFIFTVPLIIHYIPKWHRWENATVSLVFFSLNGIVSSLSGILVNILDSNGKVRLTLRLMGIWTILTWLLTGVLVYFYGYNGVAAASFFVTLTILYTVSLVKKHVVNFNFLGSIYKPIIGTVIMGCIFYALRLIFIHDVFTVLIAAGICAIVYFGVMYALVGDEIIKDVKAVFKK